MKYLSRLTALLLAFVLLFSSSVGSIAEANLSDLTRSSYDQMVRAAQEAAEAEAAAAAKEAANQPIYVDQSDVVYVPEIPDQTKRFDIYEVEEELSVSIGEEVSVTLPESGKIDLTVNADAQWQIYVPGADIWVDIAGATGSAFALTYARIGGMLSGDTAKVRALSGEEAATLNVSVAYGSALPEVEEENNFVSEPVMASAFSLRSGDANAGIMLADTTEEEQDPSQFTNCTLMVQYLFESTGKQAANPWTASVPKGSAYNYVVPSPTVLGYLPRQASVTISKDAADGDHTITVYYDAAEVDYTVLFYQQNINNDEYTLMKEEVRKGFTESAVGADLEKLVSYEGFYPLLYDETTKIAADSSTEIEIYFDRSYYLMTFDLGGGYGVEPIYARYGSAIDTTMTPTRAGYTFQGWTLNGTDASLPSTMPAEDRKYTAKWSAKTTTFNIVFWYENANDDGYTVAGSYGPVTATAGTTITSGTYANQNFEGRDSTHFTYNAAKAEVKTVAGDGSTVLNVYYTRNLYTVDFVATGVCGIPEHTHSTACQTLICTQEEHNHATDGCEKEFICSLTEHTHTSDCLTCGQTEHNHTTACCSLEEHTHNSNCCNNTGIIHKGAVHGIGALLGAEFLSWAGCTADHEEHTHGDGNCNTSGCGFENHVHSESCYKDVEHTHTDGCYEYDCGTVEHTHVDSCYKDCGQEEHTHNSTCNNANSTNVVKRIVAKYDSDISSAWETDPVKGYLDDGYVFQSSLTSKYYSYLEKMPGQNITMTATQWSGNTYTWDYYLETYEGQDLTGLTTRTDNGKTYYLYHTTSVKGNSISLTYEEDYFPITGFTQRDSSVPSFSNRHAYLYYVRNQYELKFMNNGAEVTDHTENIYYQVDISGKNFTPAYPEDLEAGAYEFEGWYTTDQCYEGSKFEFTTTDEEGNVVNATMPANDVILYANWVPKTHTVDVYLTKELADADGTTLCDQQTVSHRAFAVAPEQPTNGQYVFAGWFYMDGDQEKAFDFASMPVIQDLKIYAKWSSNTLMQYTIKYAVKNEDGTLTYIAEDTTGSALAGTTKTFDAKTGEDLIEGYQTGYFPTTNSHSLTLNIEDPTKNEFTFIYVPREKLPYTVKYVEAGTGTELATSKSVETTDAVVTETFVVISGYRPDAYQKTLVLSADESQNVITFYYTKDDEHAPVLVTHYIQNIAGTDYSEYQSSTNLDGVIGQPYSENYISIPGFVANTEHEDTLVSGTLTAAGLHLKLYYDRIAYPYEFRFVEYGTDPENVLAESVTGSALYEARVTQSAKVIPGYTLISDENQAINIAIEDPADVAKNNVKTFYYTENDVTIKYEVVGPAGCGTLDNYADILKAFSGTPNGSVPSANESFKFVGWYVDAECTTPVQNVNGTVDATTKEFMPVKNADGIYESATYYAKFVLDKATLKITKTGMSTGENAIFNVSGPGFDGQVVVPNDETVTLFVTCGDYTITEAGDWTSRYTAETEGLTDGKVTVAAGGASVTFKNSKQIKQWLDAESSVKNVFKDNE